MLFSNERKHNVAIPAQLSDGSRPNIAYLLQYLVDNVMKDERKDLFILEDNVYVIPEKRDKLRNIFLIDEQQTARNPCFDQRRRLGT